MKRQSLLVTLSILLGCQGQVADAGGAGASALTTDGRPMPTSGTFGDLELVVRDGLVSGRVKRTVRDPAIWGGEARCWFTFQAELRKGEACTPVRLVDGYESLGYSVTSVEWIPRSDGVRGALEPPDGPPTSGFLPMGDLASAR